jgi:ribosome biogenesis GTPase A
MAKVRYSFSSRRTRRIDNIRKQRQKYPDLLLKVIETSDIILEVLDARFPKEMRNKEIEELIKKKKKIIIPILNKADLMENPKRNSEGILISCANRAGIKQLRDTIKIEAKKIRGSKENNFNRIQIGVIGYPNSGKSSLINLLTGKNSAKTGAEAGFTKGVQKLRLTSDILLLDSPGVIPESHYSSTDEEKMAKTAKVGGKSFSQIKEPELAVTKIMEEYAKEIENYYKIKAKGNSEELIEKLGRKKGFLTKGNKIDEDKTSRLILKDFQEGNIKI